MRSGRLLQLGGEAARGERRGDPAQRGVGRRAGERVRRGRATPASTPAAASGSASRHGSATPSVLEARRAARPRRRRRRARRAPLRGGAGRAPRAAARRAARPRSRSTPDSTKRADRRADDLQRLGQLRGRALGGGGRVVELVREAGRHRAERGEPLAVLLDRGDAAHHRRDLAHHAVVHGRLREGEPAEVLGLDDARAGSRSRRRIRTPSAPPVSTAIAPIQVGAWWWPAGSARSPSTMQRLRAALEQQQHARRRLRPARRRSSPGAHSRTARRPATHSASCVVVEVVEQVDRRAGRRR